jgi:hypothetical protein
MEKKLLSLSIAIAGIVYSDFEVSERTDLRPFIHSDWKILKGFPRPATQEELDAYNTGVTQDTDEPIMIYRYASPLRSETITQFYTANHAYVGGGTHTRLMDEVHYLSDADIERICAVGQF